MVVERLKKCADPNSGDADCRDLAKLLAAFEAVKAENDAWREGHIKQHKQWENGCCGCMCGVGNNVSNKTDDALKALEG